MNTIFVKCKAVSILEVIQRYNLGNPVQRGKKFYLKAPDREDKSPSIAIYPDTNSWYDYGLGHGGDTVRLVSVVYKLTPYEACKKLLEDFGLSEHENINSKQIQEQIRQREQDREERLRLDEELKDFFETCVRKYKLFQQTLEEYGSRYGQDNKYYLLQMYRDKWEWICHEYNNASLEGRISIYRRVQNEYKR
jgi:DNA primase